MSNKAGTLLWNRQRITLAGNGAATDVDTGLQQPNLQFGNSSDAEPPFGAASNVSPPDGTLPASRIQVIPLAPTGVWATITHGEPWLSIVTGTIHVRFVNTSETGETINVLFWNPHTLVGPGLADTYNATFVPQDLLGDAARFAILGHSTVTNTGTSAIDGDVGVSTGTSITGYPPGVITNGAEHSNDATAIAGQAAALSAYNSLAAETPSEDLTGHDLGGMTLFPGVYKFTSSAGLTGTLTLDAQGDPNAIFVFQIGSTLTTASASHVTLINGASPANVFWQVGTSATLGTTTQFEGTIIADASITLTTGATMSGRALALTGAVTTDTNVVSIVGA
jgi:hypothetical protein